MKIILHKWKYLLSLNMLWTTLIVNAQQLTHQVTFNINDVEIVSNDGYDIVRLKDGGIMESEENAGEPQLPVISINLLLPEGAVATSVTITATQETQIPGSFTVYPVQLPAIPDFSDPPPFVEPDPLIYESNDPYPADLLLDSSTMGYRNYSIAAVSFIPFRYLPDSGELYLQTNITISVSYTISLPDHPYKLRPGGTADLMAWEYVAGTVANYTVMPSFYDEPENDPEYNILFENIFETTDLPSEQGSRVEYVIITNDTDIYGNPVGNLTNIFQEFADWKNQMGMPARVVTVDLIRANYPGVDVPEKIRKFIQEAHQKWGTEYVLLGGNAEIVHVKNKYYNKTSTF